MPGQPGETTVATYTPEEIRSILGHDVALAATIAASPTDLAAGTVMGKVTATGKLKPYADANVDGTQTAVGILKSGVPASAGDTIADVYIAGIFVEALLTGLDAAAKADLGARSSFDGSLIVPC